MEVQEAREWAVVKLMNSLRTAREERLPESVLEVLEKTLDLLKGKLSNSKRIFPIDLVCHLSFNSLARWSAMVSSVEHCLYDLYAGFDHLPITATCTLQTLGHSHSGTFKGKVDSWVGGSCLTAPTTVFAL